MKILAGTDYIIPGADLHRELEQLVLAGLGPAALDAISAHVLRRARSWTVGCKILWRFIKNPVAY